MSAVAPVADRLAGIGLDELVAEAALLARVDRKYVVPRTDLPAVLAAVPASTRMLEIEGRREFGYRSTYLDTADLASYHLAGRSHRRRFKVRTRAYLDSGSSWLEVKTRGARGVTLKTRIEHPEIRADRLGPVGATFVDDALASGGARRVAAVDLAPVLSTGYRRSTLYLPESRSRATIDVDLGWSTHAPLAERDLDRPGVAIVETKTGSTPSALDRLLWRLGHRPSSISKFGVGMAALVPGLPDLKWHRVLRRTLSVPHTLGETR
ncbi:MAG: polyphosphate polymerase domain-containing protein [Nocardioides sp.]